MKISLATLTQKIDETVTIEGWVNRMRTHPNVVFMDIRDTSAVLQTAGDPAVLPDDIGLEDLLEITGKIVKRGERFVNADQPLGEIELQITEVKIVSKSPIPPFALNVSTADIDEALRLKYRYLDLRSERMRDNIILRHKLSQAFRAYFNDNDFIEVETPVLTKGTPEGAREFVVPSRLYHGKGYVLPQSPQQFKQLLMMSGIEKYYQFARCFRDEDSRKDRQPEFTQIDVEMSFVDHTDVMHILESAVRQVIEQVAPGKKMPEGAFPIMTHAEAMSKYDSDKPDVRKNPEDPDELAFLWVIDFPMFERDEDTGKLNAMHHPFTMPDIKDISELDQSEDKLLALKTNAYDLVLNGYEIAGGSIRISSAELQHKILEVLGVDEEDIKARFGHLLEALTFSPPPHGGFALGFDRLVAVLANESSIREVMAFPKTGESKDLMMGAPSEMPDAVLKNVGMKSVDIKKK
ncbi:MAG: amino acid--tRNA ligase-related protein [bacterium]